MSFAANSGFTLVDLYLARGRLRAEIAMLGFSTVSDVFNNAPGEFIGAFTRLATTAENVNVDQRDLVVRLRDVRLVRPVEQAPAEPQSLGSRPARVVMDLDDWQVTGEVRPVDRIPWLDFATAIRNRFISVSNVSVRFVGVAEAMECDYLLVNGARISALYEMA